MNEVRDVIVGIDFSKNATQLAYYDRRLEKPQSVAEVAGTSNYEIPTALCRRADNYEFCVGTEALFFAREKNGALVEDLYDATESEVDIRVGETLLAPYKVLAEFFLGILRMLGLQDPVRDIKCLVLTLPSLSPVQVGNLTLAVQEMGFLREEYILQGYDQSFFYYAMTQRRENWNRNIGWYAFTDTHVSFQKLSVQTGAGSTPVTVRLRQMDSQWLPQDPTRRDNDFASFVHQTLGEDLYSTILLTGEGFSTDWAVKSKATLCQQQRKVFFGNNLFVKGAVAAGKERLENNKLKGYRFLCDSMVLVNVGMEMKIMGAPAYHPLIEAGKSWYEYHPSCDFLLDGVSDLVFIVSKAGEAEKSKVVMHLPGLPDRPRKTTRLHLEMSYTSQEDCDIVVEDLGFGEMFPSSGKTWTETVRWEVVDP